MCIQCAADSLPYVGMALGGLRLASSKRFGGMWRTGTASPEVSGQAIVDDAGEPARRSDGHVADPTDDARPDRATQVARADAPPARRRET